MDLIRYQAPNLAPWWAADRWSNLRDELNSFLETPFWSSTIPVSSIDDQKTAGSIMPAPLTIAASPSAAKIAPMSRSGTT